MNIRYYADAEGKKALDSKDLKVGTTVYMRVGNGPITPLVVVAVSQGSK
jgi:hypothetical protein